MIRVAVDAPSAILRAGIEGLLRRHGEIEIVETAPDVVVAYAESSADITAVSAPVIVLSDDPSPGWLRTTGVRGVLPSDCSAEELTAAIQAAAAGLLVLHPRDLAALTAADTRPAQPAGDLTPRETEILSLLADGLSNKEIGARLKISDHTVKFHVASVLGKLGASPRTEAVSLALRQGLILL